MLTNTKILSNYVMTFFVIGLAVTSTTWANSGDDHDNDGHRKYAVGSTNKYSIGSTKMWIKDDSRSFDPRFDWNCSSPGMKTVLDFLGDTTCDTDGDGMNDLISGDRGKRTLPIRISYPVHRPQAARAWERTVADLYFNGSSGDCVNRAFPGGFLFVTFGFGFNYTFTTEGPEGDLSTLFLPDTFVSPELYEEDLCMGGTGILNNPKPARGKFPVITYSHGDGGGDFVEKELLNLVRSGYIVVEIGHVGDGITFLPGPEVLGDRVPPDLALRISETGRYDTQQISDLGFPDPQDEQDIKARAEDLLAVIKFVEELNDKGRPESLLTAESKKILKRLRGKLDLDRLGFYGTSNGGNTGLLALTKPEFAERYKAAIIHVTAQISTPLQGKINGQYLEGAFFRDDVLMADGYSYNEDATGDSITHTVPMLTYIGVEDDIVTIGEWCFATGFCNPSLMGNSRPQNNPTRNNLHPLHTNGVVLNATGPQYLLNIRDLDHFGAIIIDAYDDVPSFNAVFPSPLYKESVWDGAGNFLFLGDPTDHGLPSRYQLLDAAIFNGIGDLFTRTWMDLYLKDKICSNKRDVKIVDSEGNVLVTVPKEWNNFKILKTASHFEPAAVDSAVFNNLLVGMDTDVENVVCGRRRW